MLPLRLSPFPFCIGPFKKNVNSCLTCTEVNLRCSFRANGEMKHDGSDEDSEEENEEGDYTVYECPGLAPVRRVPP